LPRERAQREMDEDEQPERQNQVVLRARSLENRDRERRGEDGGESLSPAARSEVPGQDRRRQDDAEPRKGLNEVDPAIRSGKKLELGGEHLGARAERELPENVRGIVKDAAVLDPVRDSGKVVGQRIPVVGGCRAGRQSHGGGEKRETGEKRDLLSRDSIETSGLRLGRFPSSPPEARREDDREKKPRPEN